MADSNEQAKQGVEFTAEVYKAAAIEGAGSLQGLYDSNEYRLAMYVSGVAVESILRAYRIRINPAFDSRHDLTQLAKDSRFVEKIPEALWEKYAADLAVVAVRWSNSHRFRSEAAIRRYLKRGHFDRGIKGDFLKENARRMVNASVDLITLGDQLWKN